MLKENEFECITFKGSFGGEDHHWFGELERCLHRFWYQSLTPIFIYLLFIFIANIHLFNIHIVDQILIQQDCNMHLKLLFRGITR